MLRGLRHNQSTRILPTHPSTHELWMQNDAEHTYHAACRLNTKKLIELAVGQGEARDKERSAAFAVWNCITRKHLGIISRKAGPMSYCRFLMVSRLPNLCLSLHRYPVTIHRVAVSLQWLIWQRRQSCCQLKGSAILRASRFHSGCIFGNRSL